MSPRRSSDDPTSSSAPSVAPPVGGRLRPGLAQRRGLGPAARLGEGLGVGREQDREPEPRARSGPGSPGRPRPVDRCDAGHVARREERHQGRRDLDHEDDRVPDQQARVELAEGLGDRGPEQLRVEDARGCAAPAASLRARWPARAGPKRWKRRVPRPRSMDSETTVMSEGLSGVEEELLDDRSERERREVRQGADDDHDADEQGD